ncbi:MULTISPECIES: PD-(D/E)XK motif protein [unclassified Bradyrhizobium]|uniref:PD-(D/E)XK motif protein n=1 Tax=unclassified Bradyrhizobium TaxID=2631580 RepID=UPI0029162390|nr:MULTISPECIES: PD-(D/E)XK motif protein [unclassified Bradyrhizobium]
MSDDPWKDIAPPATVDAFSAKRVDPDIPWNFFWGRALDRKCLLVLAHAPESLPTGKLPKLKGIEITDVPRGAGAERVLLFKLLEDTHRDIFERLCRDIVGCATRAASEREAVALSLARTWRWHHLLRGGLDGKLSPEEQKGLAGELLVIERLLLQCLSPSEVLDAWRGPLGSPKDFEIGRLCLEVKARRGAATPQIAISSADQLDTAGIDELYLYVVELDQAPADTFQSFTLTELAARVRDRLLLGDAGVADVLDRLLAATGFGWLDDYSDSRWVEGQSHIFRLADGFPRLGSSSLPPGVTNVRYSISLQDCVPFVIDDCGLIDAVRARRNGGGA